MKYAFFLLVLFEMNVQAQDASPKPARVIPYNARVSLMQGGTTHGWMYTTHEDELQLLTASKLELKGLQDSTFSPLPRLQSVPIEKINTITVRRKNATTRGLFIGMATGAVTGALIGLISGDDKLLPNPDPNNDPFGLGTFAVALHNAFSYTAEEKALLGAASGAVFGALTGTIIGALAKKKFVIGGKKEKYRDLQGELMRRLLVRP